MPNKTIYVSREDEEVFEKARQISGDALSAVISQALKEFVARHTEQGKGFKEVKLKIGSRNNVREQRFLGKLMGGWKGFNDERSLWLESDIFITQKGNIAIYHKRVLNASVINNPENWQEYLGDEERYELIVGASVDELTGKIPQALLTVVKDMAAKETAASEFLNI
jgi:EXLDI family protein